MTATDDPDRATANRLTRWRAHLAARRVAVPDVDDFLAFGRLSTLERLRPVLGAAEPAHCGPLRLAMLQLRQEKCAKKSQARGGQRGPEMLLAVAETDLPEDWQTTLDDMRRRTQRRDAGMLLLSGPVPPASSMIDDIAYVLRALAKTCLDHGKEVILDDAAVAAWLAREEGRGRRATGLSLQIRLLARFVAYRGARKKFRRRLEELGRDYAKRGRKQRKIKHMWVDATEMTIADVWNIAEDLRAQSLNAAPGTARRYRLALHATVLALAVNAPLRIGDLHRLRLGRELCRTGEGWSLSTDVRKTASDYESPELWPELTPFLDALLTLDSPGGELWSEYDRRVGTPMFSLTRGARGLTADWLSDVCAEHVGIGLHIVRTLWHQLAYEADRDLTWISLALCGQSGKRTAREYRERNTRGNAVRAGRNTLSDQRKRALAAAKMPN